MQKLIITSLGLILLFFISMGSSEKPTFLFDDNTPVAEVLEQLGDSPQPHKPDMSIAGVSVENGRSIIFDGISKDPSGKTMPRQSKHFVCTSCHNMVKEDPDLSVSDPQARLEYAAANNLPFLQGTTLYGVVNRTSFYNGDYDKKYGDLVKSARNNLRGAIDLCAVECSQGRTLEKWEMESILAYLWTIDLKLNDLNLSQDEYVVVQAGMREGGKKNIATTGAIDILKSKYLQASPATFLTPPDDRTKGYDFKGDPNNGSIIYHHSCLHCHDKGRYALFSLDDSKYSFKFLNRHKDRYTPFSLYQVGRYGTYPLNGKKSYMPHYTKEKMSDQQMEDLRAYIESQSKGI